MVIGMLSTLCEKNVSRLPSSMQRQYLLGTIAQIIVQLSPNVVDVFNFIFYAKHHLYLEKKRDASTHESTKPDLRSRGRNQINSNQTNSVDFMDIFNLKSSFYYITNQLLQRHIEADCEVCCDKVTIVGNNSDITMRSTHTGHSLDAVVANQSIKNEDIVTALQKYSNYDNNAESSVRCGDLRIFPESGLCWSIAGLSAVILHILVSVVSNSDSSSFRYPRVFSPQYMRHLFFAYIPHILQTPFASVEGMQAIIAFGRLSNRMQRRFIFMPQLCGVDTDSMVRSISQLLPSKSSSMKILIENQEEIKDFTADCLKFQLISSVSSEIKVDENTKSQYSTLTVTNDLLIKIAGESKDLLWVIQSIISTMISSMDNSLRSSALAALKQLLSNVQELSLFELLLVICETCPHPQITGLMIDFAKELAQAASRRNSENVTISMDTKLINITGNDLLYRIFNVTSLPIPAVAEDDVVYMSNLLKMDIKGPLISSRLCSYDFYSSIVANSHSRMNVSVFWSPLIVHAFVLRPLEEIWTQGTERNTAHVSPFDQVQERVDVVAARVNLMLFITLRLQSSLDSFKNSNDTYMDNDLLYVYFAGFKEFHGFSENEYLDDEVEVVKDLFRVCKVIWKLKQLLEMNVDIHSELDVVLMKSNVDYLFQKICILCRSILTFGLY